MILELYMTIRFLKICIVATIALLFTLFAFNNLTNFHSNLEGVEKVLTMEGIRDTHLKEWRAISNKHIHMMAYVMIIAWEILTAGLCWTGTILMIKNVRANPEKFSHSKTFALLGLTAGFLFFMIGFVIIGSEWFYMWQAIWKNLLVKSLLFSVLLLACISFISGNDLGDSVP